MARRVAFIVMGGVLAVALASQPARAWGDLPVDGDPIRYLTDPVDDPVARLQKRIDAGEQTLKFDRKHGYLESVLDALKVPSASQTLVFSKTSFQHSRISRKMPRALYFNDHTYVGWVNGGDVIEIATIDPKQGAQFYLLDQSRDEHPSFIRQTHECLQCHVNSKTQGVPGLFVRSVYPDSSGQPIFKAGTFVTTDESPMNERWGGWYVTGTHGKQRHMGNAVLTDENHPERLDMNSGANLLNLDDRINTAPYLNGQSDIVALMVLEHQTQIHNFITLAGFETRIALHYQDGINRAFGEPAGTISESTQHRIENSAEKLVRALLFVKEFPLTDPILGSNSFAEDFQNAGLRDSQGRSLRDFDLKRRMFKYPCSYLIHSDAFDALPVQTKQYVYKRLFAILSGRDKSATFSHLSAEDRLAILQILRETKPDLPEEFHATTLPADPFAH
jgi:hypothetical protein